MTPTKWRARWVDAAGIEMIDETFEFDPAAHEMAPHIRPEGLISLVLDAPRFYPDGLAGLRAHLGGGYIEPVVAAPERLLIIDEEGRISGRWAPNPHPLALDALGERVWGPLVIIEPVAAEEAGDA